ncbi:MAG: MFS transporter, partial [Phycisphaeraceae bacterium]
FAVIGGWIGDRVPRKWLLLVCDEARAGLMLLCFFLLGIFAGTGGAAMDAAYHPYVFAALAAIGAFAAVFNPTRAAIVPEVVRRDQLQPANAVILVINIIASLIGLKLGEMIIDTEASDSVRTGLLIGGVFYLVSGTFFAFIKTRPSHVTVDAGGETSDAAAAAGAKVAAIWDGLRYAVEHKRVLKLFLANLLVWGPAVTVYVGVMGLAKQQLALTGDPLLREYAQLSMSVGGGMLLGGGIIAAIRTRRESPIVLTLAIFGAGLALIVLAAEPLRWTSISARWTMYPAALAVGACGNVAIVSIVSLLQSVSPDRVRGCVMGANAMVTTTFTTLVYFVIWRVPGADEAMQPVLLVVGPVLVGVGAVTLVRHLRSGPMANPGAHFFWHASRLFVYVYHRLEVFGKHHVPGTGPVVIASNHTTGLDPLLLQAAVARPIRWLMWSHYLFTPLAPLWRAIRPIAMETGKPALAQVRELVRALKQGDIVGVFPEGGLQREHRELGELEEGVVVAARRGDAVIVPAWVHGTPRTKSMLWHFLRPSVSTVVFGEPWRVPQDMDAKQATAELRKRMAALAERVPEERRRHAVTPASDDA